MATELDAAAKKMEEEFRHLQSRLLERFSSTAMSRTSWILALVGVLLLCYTLYKTPNDQGGLPLPLNHDYLLHFAAASIVGIVMNLLAFPIHLLACINERNLNKTQPPTLKVIENCIHKQNNLIIAIQVLDMAIFLFGSLLQISAFLIALPAILTPNDPNTYRGSAFKAAVYSFRPVVYSSCILMSFTMLFEFPRDWALD